MAKVKKDQIWVEIGKDRGNINIVKVHAAKGKAETHKGTFISIKRLESGRHYRLIGK